jgi:ATP-binding protein involved in chromosome partitioning
MARLPIFICRTHLVAVKQLGHRRHAMRIDFAKLAFAKARHPLNKHYAILCLLFRNFATGSFMADLLTKDHVLAALKAIKVPGGQDIVSAGLLSEIVINKGKVYFALNVPQRQAHGFESVRKAAEDAVKALPGAAGALVTLTADAKAKPEPQPAPQGKPDRGIGQVKHIIAVASGKGGVGKSTTAVNLALGFQENGLRVGVFDADVYGPSMPRLLAIRSKPELIGDNLLAPVQNYGLKVMSMGFLVEEETPMIWRGPMVISAITQMLKDVAWGELDIMVVDMPPGTGDTQLTMAQQVPLSGAVIVSTPQDLALIDARKGLNMFKRVNVPVLGIVENMSFFLCPNCGHRSDIFSHGGARHEAERLGVPFLGELPLHMAIRETSDAGRPIVVSDPSSLHAQLYKNIAAAVWAQLSGESALPPPPRIVLE